MVAAIGLVVVVAGTPPARGQTGPVEGFADLVERVGPAVVNISTTREQAAPEEVPLPQFPPGSPFEEFFRDFFEREPAGSAAAAAPWRVARLGLRHRS